MLRITAAHAAGLIVASCVSTVPPPRLFVLSPVKAMPTGDHAVAGPSILVAQTQVPDYLDRPQIVERTTANELKLVEADHWGERLSINIARVVAQNLSAMVPGDANVSAAARSSVPYDYQVVLTLNNFELDQNGAAILGGRWSVTNAEGTKELAAASVSLREPAAQPGIVAAVEAMNSNLGAVCRDIAAEIKKLTASGAK
jgi:uncharacterized lipoprotein YmbA